MTHEFTPLVRGYGTFNGHVISEISSRPTSREITFHRRPPNATSWSKSLPQPISGDFLDPLTPRSGRGAERNNSDANCMYNCQLPSTLLTRKGTLILYTRADENPTSADARRKQLENVGNYHVNQCALPSTLGTFCDSVLQYEKNSVKTSTGSRVEGCQPGRQLQGYIGYLKNNVICSSSIKALMNTLKEETKFGSRKLDSTNCLEDELADLGIDLGDFLQGRGGEASVPRSLTTIYSETKQATLRENRLKAVELEMTNAATQAALLEQRLAERREQEGPAGLSSRLRQQYKKAYTVKNVVKDHTILNKQLDKMLDALASTDAVGLTTSRGGLPTSRGSLTTRSDSAYGTMSRSNIRSSSAVSRKTRVTSGRTTRSSFKDSSEQEEFDEDFDDQHMDRYLQKTMKRKVLSESVTVRDLLNDTSDFKTDAQRRPSIDSIESYLHDADDTKLTSLLISKPEVQFNENVTKFPIDPLEYTTHDVADQEVSETDVSDHAFKVTDVADLQLEESDDKIKQSVLENLNVGKAAIKKVAAAMEEKLNVKNDDAEEKFIVQLNNEVKNKFESTVDLLSTLPHETAPLRTAAWLAHQQSLQQQLDLSVEIPLAQGATLSYSTKDAAETRQLNNAAETRQLNNAAETRQLNNVEPTVEILPSSTTTLATSTAAAAAAAASSSSRDSLSTTLLKDDKAGADIASKISHMDANSTVSPTKITSVPSGERKSASRQLTSLSSSNTTNHKGSTSKSLSAGKIAKVEKLSSQEKRSEVGAVMGKTHVEEAASVSPLKESASKVTIDTPESTPLLNLEATIEKEQVQVIVESVSAGAPEDAQGNVASRTPTVSRRAPIVVKSRKSSAVVSFAMAPAKTSSADHSVGEPWKDDLKEAFESEKEKREKVKLALEEKEKQERLRRLQDALALQQQIMSAEEKRLEEEASAKQRQIELERELEEADEEERIANAMEEEARLQILDARRKAREEREIRRKEEINRRKEEIRRRKEEEMRREQLRDEQESELLKRLGDVEGRQRQQVEAEKRRLEEEAALATSLEEEEERLLSIAQEEELRMEEIDRQVEEEQLAAIREERLDVEERKRELLERQKREQEERDMKMKAAAMAEAQLEAEREQLVALEAKKTEELELQRLAQQAEEMRIAEELRHQLEERRFGLLARRNKNLDMKSNLFNLQSNQKITRAWVFSYYLTWPREHFEKPFGGGTDKKRNASQSPRKKEVPLSAQISVEKLPAINE